MLLQKGLQFSKQRCHALRLDSQKDKVAFLYHLSGIAHGAAKLFCQCLCFFRRAVAQQDLFTACAAADGLRHGAAHVAGADKTKGIFHKESLPMLFPYYNKFISAIQASCKCRQDGVQLI